MEKIHDMEIVSSFSVLDLPEPQRSKTLAAMNMTEAEFRENLAGHKSAIQERQERAEATGNTGGMHYTDGLPAIQVDGKGEKVLASIPDSE